MRKILTFIFIFTMKITLAQPNFEGSIEMKMSTPERPEMGTTKLYFSTLGGRIETEMKFSPNMKPFKTVRIYKKEKPDLYYVLNDATESYSETDLAKYTATDKTENDVKVTVVGKEKLQNLNCVHVLISSKNGDTEMWTTKELMDYDLYKNLNESDARSRNSSFSKALIDAKAEGFPVKTLKKDSKGGNIIIELVKIDKKPLDKSLFEIPVTYLKTETPTSGLEGVMKEIKQMGIEAEKEE